MYIELINNCMDEDLVPADCIVQDLVPADYIVQCPVLISQNEVWRDLYFKNSRIVVPIVHLSGNWKPPQSSGHCQGRLILVFK